MSLFIRSLPAVLLSALMIAPISFAQPREVAGVQLQSTGQVAPSTSIDEELYRMSSQAGVIFAGQVLSVRPQLDLAYGSSSGWVEIEFRIDQAIRGCAGQPTYTLREWSGLWSGGHQRYTVGQRLLMLLHSPSASGLSSPVGGQDGAIPLAGTGTSPRPQDGFVTAAEQAVDLRWVEARLLRPAASGSATTMHPGASAPLQAVYPDGEPLAAPDTKAARALRSSVPGAMRANGNEAAPAGFESPITVPLSGTAGQGISLRSILALLAAWQTEQTSAAR